MSSKPPHSTCRQILTSQFAEHGIEVTVSNRPPLQPAANVRGLACPHGIAYWVEITGRTSTAPDQA